MVGTGIDSSDYQFMIAIADKFFSFSNNTVLVPKAAIASSERNYTVGTIIVASVLDL